MVIPNRDLSEPAFGQFFVKLGQLIALLSDKILQLLDALHLDGLGSFIGIRLLLQLSQEENLLRNIVIGFPVVVTIQQFLLKHQQCGLSGQRCHSAAQASLIYTTDVLFHIVFLTGCGSIRR